MQKYFRLASVAKRFFLTLVKTFHLWEKDEPWRKNVFIQSYFELRALHIQTGPKRIMHYPESAVLQFL